MRWVYFRNFPGSPLRLLVLESPGEEAEICIFKVSQPIGTQLALGSLTVICKISSLRARPEKMQPRAFLTLSEHLLYANCSALTVRRIERSTREECTTSLGRNSSHLSRAYHTPGTSLRTLHTLAGMILTVTSGSGNYYFPSSTNRGTEA